MQDERLTQADAELERALRGLRVARAPIDRDRLMFRAGQVAARRRTRGWQCIAAALLVALGASVSLHGVPREPQQVVRVVERVVVQPVPTVSPMPAVTWKPSAGWIEYVRMRDEVVAKGIDALPQPESADADPRAAEWQDRVLAALRRPSPRDRWANLWDLLEGDGT